MTGRQKVKVVIAAGGSGGHIFPAVAVARTLRAQSDTNDVLFVGSDKGLDKRIFEKEGFAYALLSANKLSLRNKLLLPVFFIKLLLDFIRSILIIKKYKPDVVVGFGGYVSCPIVMAGRLAGAATLLHEQNVSPGRSNRLLFRFVDRIAVSFKETGSRLGSARNKMILTGNPIRREICRDDRAGGIRKFGLDEGKCTILVVGGSQGAHRLNEAFLQALAGMPESARKALQVIHLTGIKDYEWVLREYTALGITQSVHSFLDRIEEAYSACDLMVTRSGASAIYEAAFFARPLILVPYPYAMDHQLENARVFEAAGAAVVLEEKRLTPDSFRDVILGLMHDKNRLHAMAAAAKRLGVPEASDNVAGLIGALAEHENGTECHET